MRNGYDFCYTGYINPRHNKVEINKTIIVYFKSERLKTKFFYVVCFVCAVMRILIEKKKRHMMEKSADDNISFLINCFI